MTFWTRVANVVLVSGVLMLILSASRRIGLTVLWMFPWMFICAFQLVLLCIYGHSVISVDMLLNVQTTNPSEAWELLSHLYVELAIVLAMYITSTVVAVIAVLRKWKCRDRFRSKCRRLALYLSASGIVAIVLACVSPAVVHHLDRQIFPFNVGCNVYHAAVRSHAISNYPNSSASFKYDAHDTDASDNARKITIVVIGETSRADNWSMYGYGHPTTLPIDTMRGIFSFGRALSESNTTHKSVPLLLTHLNATSYGDSIYYVKGLPAAFSESGWNTCFISNQRRNHSLIDMIAAQSEKHIFIKDTDGNYTLDDDILPHLRQVLSSGAQRQLIVLHTYGSHFNYEDRYRRADALFPDASTQPSSVKNRDRIVKAYDNTIHYTAHFLREVIIAARSTGTQTALIYTSDHGEDLYDDSRCLFLHASPKPSYWQLHVPFLIWLSDEYVSAHPDVAQHLRQNERMPVSSSAALFHTVLMLSGIESPRLRHDLSLTSADYRPVSPVYLNDYNEPVSLYQAGFEDADFAMLRRLGIDAAK